jgi:hypothetical protein
LATRYLGNPDRWVEIVALNGLRSPWVDETGFDLPLLANATEHSATVASAQDLRVGQAVWLVGRGIHSAKRHVTSIDQGTDKKAVIGLDGDSVVSFMLAKAPVLHTNLPNTVNSQMLIMIPSEDEATVVENTKSLGSVNNLDHLLEVGGTDLLLGSNRDLVVGPDGDFRLAYGLTNIIQIANINLNLPKGALPRHPELGVAIEPGTSLADLNPAGVQSALTSALGAYAMFESVDDVSMTLAGGALKIGMAITVKGLVDRLNIAVDVAQ